MNYVPQKVWKSYSLNSYHRYETHWDEDHTLSMNFIQLFLQCIPNFIYWHILYFVCFYQFMNRNWSWIENNLCQCTAERYTEEHYLDPYYTLRLRSIHGEGSYSHWTKSKPCMHTRYSILWNVFWIFKICLWLNGTHTAIQTSFSSDLIPILKTKTGIITSENTERCQIDLPLS